MVALSILRVSGPRAVAPAVQPRGAVRTRIVAILGLSILAGVAAVAFALRGRDGTPATGARSGCPRIRCCPDTSGASPPT
jgi:hypothetical protein